jgi:hypothetical protein
VAACVLMGYWMMAVVAVWWKKSAHVSTTRTYTSLGTGSSWTATIPGEPPLPVAPGEAGSMVTLRGLPGSHRVIGWPLLG